MKVHESLHASSCICMMKFFDLTLFHESLHENILIDLTLKNSHMFQKVMYKVKNKDNVFRIRDFTSSDNVDISRFVEGTNKKGETQLQAQIVVLYPDEYHDIITIKDSHESEVQHLKAMISERESQIMKLKKENKEKVQVNSDEVMQLKEDIFNITQEHDKEVSKLHQEISRLEKSHLEELEDLKEKHSNQLLAIDETHQKEIEKLNEQYIAKLDEVNDKLLSEVQGNKQASDNLRDEMLTITQDHKKEIDKLHQEKSNIEKTHANETLELTKAHQDEVTQLNEDISSLKQAHLEDLREIDKVHSDEVEKIRNTFLRLVSLETTEDLSEIEDIEKSVPAILKPFMRKHIKQVEDLKQRKLNKSPEKTIKTYELSGKKEKE